MPTDQPLDLAGVTHFYLRTGDRPAPAAPARPWFLCGFRYDTYDVRSQTKISGAFTVGLPVIELSGEALWPAELIRPIDPQALDSEPWPGILYEPPACELTLANLPVFRDKILQSILRHFTVRLLHNPSLTLYSHPAESAEEFTRRCHECQLTNMGDDLLQLKLKYERHLNRIIQKSKVLGTESLAESATDLSVNSNRKLWILKVREALTCLFQDPRETPEYVADFVQPIEDDIAEALQNLYTAAWTEQKSCSETLRSMARDIQDYSFHLQRGDLVLGLLAIVWI